MNDWLQKNYFRLYEDLDSLKKGHPSGRDNGRWTAEIQGKLDACTLLKDTNINNLNIDEIRRVFDGQPLSEVDKSHHHHYKDGANKFIDSFISELRDGQHIKK